MITNVSIVDVWHRLGGGPIRRGRATAWWREGDAPNIAVDVERGVWFDHARGVGGGVLDLVRTVSDCNKSDAVRWLCSEGFIQDHEASPDERRRAAAHCDALDAVAGDIEYWRQGRITNLECEKINAIARDDEARLAASASELYRLQTDGAAVVEAYRNHLAQDPREARRLIQWGREDDRHAQVVAAAIVCMLAKAQERNHAAT